MRYQAGLLIYTRRGLRLRVAVAASRSTRSAFHPFFFKASLEHNKNGNWGFKRTDPKADRTSTRNNDPSASESKTYYQRRSRCQPDQSWGNFLRYLCHGIPTWQRGIGINANDLTNLVLLQELFIEYLVNEGLTRAKRDKRKTVYYKDLGTVRNRRCNGYQLTCLQPLRLAK